MKKILLGLALTTLLAGCGSDSGPPVKQHIPPETQGPGNSLVYEGPPPQTEDVQRFKVNLWDSLAVVERCGECHGSGGQLPTFVRRDDINLAYAEAASLVNLGTPALSLMVTKVAEGHNCWLTSHSACADIISGHISAWAESAGTITQQVLLTAPVDKSVAASKNFPADSSDFAATVYPLLSQHCSDCHRQGATLNQQPYIASTDVDVAYAGARSRIRLDSPADSRLVQRLALEGHNCWSDNCSNDALALQEAIEAFVARLPEVDINPRLVISKALALGDGVVANTSGRVESDIIAKYEFKAREGSTAFDTSGVEPAANLQLFGEVEWMASWGLRINDGKAQASTATSRKLFDLITRTGEYSIEAWVIPDNVTQEEARIVSYSGSTQVRNFALDQSLYRYEFLHRSSTTDGNGLPVLFTPDADQRLQASLQHVVITYDAVAGRRIYVNGEYTDDADPTAPGHLNEWDSSYALVVGNEVSADRLWRGALRFLAIHNRALTPEAIAANYEAGVGEKYYLLFNISHLIDMSAAYIVFQVQVFDDYSYLFSEPFFTSLTDEAVPQVPLEGIRIGINGREAIIGQVFAALQTDINPDAYREGRQSLSRQGAVIGLEQGPESDTFFLTFDRLGSHEFVRVEAEPPAPSPTADIPDQAQLGIKTFAAINQSLAAITGISPSAPTVAATYQKVEQQLPTLTSMDSFLAAHQMGITQLAVSYCNALVGDSPNGSAARQAFFEGFDFGAPVTTAFNSSGRQQIITPLLQRLMAAPVNGQALAAQPDTTVINAELNRLIDTMTACGNNCSAGRTYTVVKATCAAALGSAMMLIQ